MDEEDNEPRPSCNCKNSLCVQRYCACFGSRWYCSDACACASCMNTLDNEAFVEERAELILSKNKPSASAASQSKACTCRKSECKKKYCECFKNRVACTERCQCQGCANTYGAKGGAGTVLPHNNNGDSAGTSVTDEGSVSATGAAGVKENSVEPSNIGQHVNAPSFAFSNSLPDQDIFIQNVRTLKMHRQSSVQALLHGSENSTPQDMLVDPNVNNGSLVGPSRN